MVGVRTRVVSALIGVFLAASLSDGSLLRAKWHLESATGGLGGVQQHVQNAPGHAEQAVRWKGVEKFTADVRSSVKRFSNALRDIGNAFQGSTYQESKTHEKAQGLELLQARQLDGVDLGADTENATIVGWETGGCFGWVELFLANSILGVALTNLSIWLILAFKLETEYSANLTPKFVMLWLLFSLLTGVLAWFTGLYAFKQRRSTDTILFERLSRDSHLPSPKDFKLQPQENLHISLS